MKLSQRLKAIVAFVKPCKTAADIGCDHGMTAAELILSGRAERVIAGDISKASLEKAVVLAASLGLSDRLEARAGDGLEVLQAGEADCIVIAGLGAMLMIKMLEAQEAAAKAAKQLVLSPNNYEERLRSYCAEAGFYIERENYVYDGGRYYPVLSVQPGTPEEYTPAELYLGKAERSEGGYYEFLAEKRRALRRIIRQAEAGGGQALEAERILNLLEGAGDENEGKRF